MTKLRKPPEGFVHVYYELDGTIAEVPEIGLHHYYATGWRLLKPDDVPAEKPPAQPKPISESEAAKASAKAKE